MNDWPDLEVSCSCGKAGLILWDRAAGRYFSPTPGWVYHPGNPNDLDRDDERLWNCGRPGHHQAGVQLRRRDS